VRLAENRPQKQVQERLREDISLTERLSQPPLYNLMQLELLSAAVVSPLLLSVSSDAAAVISPGSLS